MAFTTLGFSLPYLIVNAEAGDRAAWNGTLSITATVQNVGSSTTTEPLNQAPGSSSSADSAASNIEVLLTPHKRSLSGAIDIGYLTAPAISQNSLEQVTGTLTLPSMPTGLPSAHTHFYVRLVSNYGGAVLTANDRSHTSKPIPVRVIGTALPELQAVKLYVPPTMQPGDTIAPVIEVANLGTADTSTQGTLEVALVASTTPSFTVGSSIIAIYDVANIPPASNTPTSTTISNALDSVQTANNVVTITGSNVTLPTSPNGYYLGVVVDPYGEFSQLSLPSNLLEVIHVVGPAINGLPAAGVLSSAYTNLFPSPVSGTAVGVTSSKTTVR
jgi:hypothetical protein